MKASLRSLTKRTGSGSVSQRYDYGSEDPDPYQNVTDGSEHWHKLDSFFYLKKFDLKSEKIILGPFWPSFHVMIWNQEFILPCCHSTGVVGRPMRSKAGELSLLCSSLTLLAPCLHQLPKTPIESHQKRFRYLIRWVYYRQNSGFWVLINTLELCYVQKCGNQGVAAVSGHFWILMQSGSRQAFFNIIIWTLFWWIKYCINNLYTNKKSSCSMRSLKFSTEAFQKLGSSLFSLPFWVLFWTAWIRIQSTCTLLMYQFDNFFH